MRVAHHDDWWLDEEEWQASADEFAASLPPLRSRDDGRLRAVVAGLLRAAEKVAKPAAAPSRRINAQGRLKL